MPHSDTNISNLKINRGTYLAIQQNLSSIGENELIITTDKTLPVPGTSDIGKVVTVAGTGDYTLATPTAYMTNPMTAQDDIIIGGSSGSPSRLAKGTSGQVLSVNPSGHLAWLAAAGITEISTQYIRITDLAAGVYKLTYNGTKYLYYYGTSSTTTHTVAGGSGAVVLNVSKYSTTYWQWYYINSNSINTLPTIYYGYTYSSGGSTGSKALNSLITSYNNYYPIRSYTTGLQISSYSGSTNCQLYVPYAIYNKYGVVKPAYNTSGTASLTTSSTSYSNSPTINERTTTTGKYYAVEVDSAGRLFVNVPWEGGSGMVNPMTTSGDIIYGGSSGTPTRLALGTANQVLKVNSAGTGIEWGTGGSGGNPVQDLTSNTAGTLDATAWGTLKSSHTYTISSPTMTGLDSTYEFVNIKLSINSANQLVKLNKNTTNKYSGMFYIEESTNLYEIAVYYNGTSIILRCAVVY